MDALLPIWIIMLLIAAWMIVMCLKVIGREVEYTEALHRLKIGACALRASNQRRLRQRLADARQRMRETEERRAARNAADQARRREEQLVAAASTGMADELDTADSSRSPRIEPELHAAAVA